MFLPYIVDVPMARLPIANWVLIGLTILMQRQASHQHSVLEGTPTTQSAPAKK